MSDAPSATLDRTFEILGWYFLGVDAVASVERALASGYVHLDAKPQDVFESALLGSTYDIEHDRRADLVSRWLLHGPQVATTSGVIPAGALSDAECINCLGFVADHMVSHFKGALAEMLALGPLCDLIDTLVTDGSVPPGGTLYVGRDVAQRSLRTTGTGDATWGAFTHGADALLVHGRANGDLDVSLVVEIKGGRYRPAEVRRQLASHVHRLDAGVRLADRTCEAGHVTAVNVIKVVVRPTTAWRISQKWWTTKDGFELEIPEEPPVNVKVLSPDSRTREIVLPWARDVLDEAGLNMTMWYVTRLANHLHGGGEYPENWSQPGDAGLNALKESLYYTLLRPLPAPALRRATKLYNFYGWGYERAADSREMLW